MSDERRQQPTDPGAAPERQRSAERAGGVVIAFVGADATGKSTLVNETARWLGDSHLVNVIHTGKPPSTWLTAPANAALQLMRQRRRRAGRVDGHDHASGSNPSLHTFKGLSSLPHALRATALGWDRQRLILKARRRAAAGEIIVCDRYPSGIMGAMDSPRLEEAPLATGLTARIFNRLARLEKQLYRRIPPPDIVLRLKVSLETALRRNRERQDQDGEAYLEARHARSRDWHVPGSGSVHEIDTERSLEETIGQVKDAIRSSL